MNINEKTIDHFQFPRNLGILEQPDGFSYYQEKGCKDSIKFSINIDDNDIITDVKAIAEGCAFITACTSILTVIVKNKTIQEAWKIDKDFIANELDGLPLEKMHCANMAVYALRKAITDYLMITGRNVMNW